MSTDPFSGIPNAGGSGYEGTILATRQERTTALAHTTSDPLAGPFMTSRQITDSSDDPGYAVPWPPRAASAASETTHRMTRLLAGQEG